MPSDGNITLVLDRIRSGELEAEKDLFQLVYGELRKIAAAQLRHERSNHTLQPTALVHETYLRMLGRSGASYENRAHFFAAAARAMRRILVDHARYARAQRRGGARTPVELTDLVAMIADRTDEILAVDEALDRLNEISPRQRSVVELRFYAGFSEEEIGEILQLSARTIKREWAAARAWLHGEFRAAPPPVD